MKLITQLKTISPQAILDAGGGEEYAKKNGYDAKKTNISGLIFLSIQETKEALRMLRK